MDNMQGLTVLQYIALTIDMLFVFIFFYMVMKNIQSMRMSGIFKGMCFVFGIWIVARLFNFAITAQVFGTIISYSFLAVIILFPEEFKKVLDHYGRRNVSKWNKDKLLNKEGRKAIAEAAIELSRKKEGAFIVIARESSLYEEAERGDILGEINVTSRMIQTLFQREGDYSKGALIIQDNKMIAANCMLDIAKKEDLIRVGAGGRHLAALHISYAKDCVVLVVSGSTGKITIAGKEGKNVKYKFAMETTQTNIHDGLNAFDIEKLIEGFLANKSVSKETLKKAENSQNKSLTKEERQQELKRKKEEREKERQQRKENRKKGVKNPKTKKSKQKESEQVSRGFGGYDR